jgi:anaerobic selenocysteine-containing dehydrogenase
LAEVRKSFCRVCINHCSIDVEVDDGIVTRVRGNRHNPLYGGYTCVKGRSQPELLRSEHRLLHSLKRQPDGSHAEIPVGQAMDEIAEKLAAIRDQFGPRAIAGYAGTMAMVAAAPTAGPCYAALMEAIGTPMLFNPNTLDKGGKQTAQSLLGYWSAPSQGFDAPEAMLLIGINPLITYTGFPAGSPKRWLADTLAGGCKLIVVDPRRTEVARRADWYLQAAPGHDASILSAMLKVIIAEELYDQDFVARHVRGLPELTAALRGIDPAIVADLAGISAEDLVGAARCYANARRGYAMAGTGPNMSGYGTLIEYLVLVLETLCGRWLREGDPVRASPALLPGFTPRAQARSPAEDWALPGRLRIRGLKETKAGMPTAILPEEILQPGEGQIRALVSWAGNPAVAFPDQRRTARALESLDLFVQIDPWYSESSRLADYVIAPTMGLEAASTTVFLDTLSRRGTGYGLARSYAQYTPAIAARPAGSELIEDWEFFYGVLTRMGYPVWLLPYGVADPSARVQLTAKPSTEELLEILSAGSRVPFASIKAREGGALFPDDPIIVAGPSETAGRLDVGNAPMLALMQELARDDSATSATRESEFPFRLLCRRPNHVYNTSANTPATNNGRPYNPAFLNPDDMAELGIEAGSIVRITSSLDTIQAIAHPDPDLLRGVLSMAFGYGAPPPRDRLFAEIGSSPNRLIPTDEVYDQYTGQPRMSNLPVSVVPESRSSAT